MQDLDHGMTVKVVIEHEATLTVRELVAIVAMLDSTRDTWELLNPENRSLVEGGFNKLKRVLRFGGMS